MGQAWSYEHGGKRFGFRQHFRVRVWPNLVDLYWGEHCQVLATPTDAHEVLRGVAFPRVQGSESAKPADLPRSCRKASRPRRRVTKQLGNADLGCNRLPFVTPRTRGVGRGRSRIVDAITGLGLSLAFQQANFLAEPFERGTLRITNLPIARSRSCRP